MINEKIKWELIREPGEKQRANILMLIIDKHAKLGVTVLKMVNQTLKQNRETRNRKEHSAVHEH